MQLAPLTPSHHAFAGSLPYPEAGEVPPHRDDSPRRRAVPFASPKSDMSPQSIATKGLIYTKKTVLTLGFASPHPYGVYRSDANHRVLFHGIGLVSQDDSRLTSSHLRFDRFTPLPSSLDAFTRSPPYPAHRGDSPRRRAVPFASPKSDMSPQPTVTKWLTYTKKTVLTLGLRHPTPMACTDRMQTIGSGFTEPFRKEDPRLTSSRLRFNI